MGCIPICLSNVAFFTLTGNVNARCEQSLTQCSTLTDTLTDTILRRYLDSRFKLLFTCERTYRILEHWFQICLLSYKKNWYTALAHKTVTRIICWLITKCFLVFHSRRKVRDPNETEEEREARRAERRKRREEKAKRESEKSTRESINSQSQIKVPKILTAHRAQLMEGTLSAWHKDHKNSWKSGPLLSWERFKRIPK